MANEITVPDLTRVGRYKGTLHEDLDVFGFYFGLHHEYRSRFRRCIPNIRGRYDCLPDFKEMFLDAYFRSFYSLDDAVYRRDLLGELLDNKKFNALFWKAYWKLPSKEPSTVYTTDRYGEPFKESAVKSGITSIRKYLEFPISLEVLATLPSDVEAVRDIRRFAERARRSIENYAKLVAPLLKELSAKMESGNLEQAAAWANYCLEQIKPHIPGFEDLLKIRKKMLYYLNLCTPYELECNGKRIPSCKPEFLDAGRREGHIAKAYNPNYFKFGRDDKRKLLVSKLNVPNDIHWDPDSRGTFIHGPNSMGKTVYLETIALNVHLAMAGLYCFAESCEMSPVGQIFPCFDLGDSLGEGHFGTGARKVLDMAKHVGFDDIVLLDEVGGGTEPETERVISKGISDALVQTGITFFDVTHDKGTWTHYADGKGIRILRVADLDDKKHKYRVWPGIAEGGYGMKIAKKKGIDPVSIRKRLVQRLC